MNRVVADQHIALAFERSFQKRCRTFCPTDLAATVKIVTGMRPVLHHITLIPHAVVEVATVFLRLVSAEATRTFRRSHLKQSPVTKNSTAIDECANIAIERGTVNESENAFVTGVDSGNLTENERRKDVTGTCADPIWNDVPVATQTPSVDATTPDGTHDLRGRDGINAYHLMSGGRVLSQGQEDGTLNRLIPKLGC